MKDIVLMGDPRVAAITVRECGEELVDVRDRGTLAVAEHADPASSAYPFLRRSVVESLERAQRALPPGLRLLVVEGFRPYELQRFYFERHRQRLMEADPELSGAAADLSASRFVSPPEVAPHVSGAAVDLTLVDRSGVPIDMGTPIDASPEESDGACYFAADNITAQARTNRELLASALSGAGLVNYPTEWWHWSYGDRYWALMTRRPHALFGPVRAPADARTRR